MTAPFSGAGTLSAFAVAPGYASFGGSGSLADTLVIVEPQAEAASGVGQLSMVLDQPAPYPLPGEFPDWEHVLVDLLTPITYTCTMLPPTKELTEAAFPLILVRRMGGGLDYNGITDRAQCKAACFSYTRSQSYQIAQQVREAFNACVGGVEVNSVLIDFAQEATGVIEMADLDPLSRVVEVDWFFWARRQFPAR